MQNEVEGADRFDKDNSEEEVFTKENKWSRLQRVLHLPRAKETKTDRRLVQVRVAGALGK